MARILIAEDERDIRDLIVYSLQFDGFFVTAAKDGIEAVQIADQEDFDLILLDVRMPRMDGYQVCNHLKKSTKTKDIPIIFLSAKGQETEVHEGLAIGAEDYILKPFAPNHLIERIRKILAESEKT